jgi:hypothetical protein
MAGSLNAPTRKHDLAALLKKLENDPKATELVTKLIEILAERRQPKRPAPKSPRR